MARTFTMELHGEGVDAKTAREGRRSPSLRRWNELRGHGVLHGAGAQHLPKSAGRNDL